MLTALLDDRPLAAGELARLAGVSPATASAHLARLLDGGLVTVIKQGRHRTTGLPGPRSPPPWRRWRTSRSARSGRCAACASPARRPRWPRPGPATTTSPGRAGVALLDALLARGILAPAPGGGQLAECGPGGGASPEAGGPARSPGDGAVWAGSGGPAADGPAADGPAADGPSADGSGDGGPAADGSGDGGSGGGAASAGSGSPGRPRRRRRFPAGFGVTAAGMATLTSFGLNIGALEKTRRRFAGACLDWTERKPAPERGARGGRHRTAAGARLDRARAVQAPRGPGDPGRRTRRVLRRPFGLGPWRI